MSDAGDTNAPNAPAGWYSAPEDKRKQRYWDGHVWTDQYHEPGPAPGERPQRPHLHVDNRYAWGFVAVVAVLSALQTLWVSVPIWAGFVLGIAGNWYCATQDDKQIAAAGYDRFGSAFGTILTPIYLVLRARRIRGAWWIVAGWVAVAILGSIIANHARYDAERVSFDSAKLQKQLTSAIHSQTGEAVAVMCPPDPRVKVHGGTVECEVDGSDGETVHVLVRPIDGQGHYQWHLEQ